MPYLLWQLITTGEVYGIVSFEKKASTFKEFLNSRCYSNDVELEYYDNFHYALFSNSLLKSLDMA